ncbi:MAG: hypothetical protein D6773_13160, partial [Alphaproteobacteria bacterium]
IRRIGPLGALLRPVGWAVAAMLCAYGLASLGSTFWRSYQRHQAYTQPAHQDRSILDVLFKSDLPEDPIDLVVRDVDGQLRKLVAGRSEISRFTNATILMLDRERDAVKRQASADIAQLFDHAFADREQAVAAYADWFFEWKRSYVILKEAFASAATRFIETGEYESLTEAVERDLKDYFMRHYMAQVLKPEVREEQISRGIEEAARRAHESYRRVIANSELRLQLFLARHTRHLEKLPADARLSTLRLDWDAQKWKAPTYLMEDAAFEGIAGIGVAAGTGLLGARILAPALRKATARSFSALSRRFVTAFGARIALAEKGAVAGTLVEPGGGTVVGAITGILIGVAADYFINKADAHFNREAFIAANREALDATIGL